MVTMVLFAGYLIFGRVLPWSVAVTLALVWGRKSRSWLTVTLLLLIGLLEDIAYLRPLGLGSLVLVTIMALTWLIESQYRSRYLWWWYLLGAGGEVIFRWVEGRPIILGVIVMQLGALMAFRWLLRRFTEAEGIYVGS